MPNQPIPPSNATAMITEYSAYMTGHGVDMKTQTQSIAFDGSILQHWLATVLPFASEIRIFPGVYPLGSPNAGRTTVILWPYQNGQPAVDGSGKAISPFNDGQGFP